MKTIDKTNTKKRLAVSFKHYDSLRYRLVFTCVVFLFAAIGAYFIFFSHASNLAADFDNDSRVGAADLSLLSINWQKTNATHSIGDADGDGIVNAFDLSYLADEWGQSTSTGGQPANSINIEADYGVVNSTSPTSTIISSNVTKFKQALAAAKSQNKTIWIPNGTFVLDDANTIGGTITIPDGLTIQGGSITGASIKGNFNFGSNTSYNNLKIVLNGVKDKNVTNIVNVHDVMFSYVDFEGSGDYYKDSSGLVLIAAYSWKGVYGATYNITFSHCTIGTNQDGIGNGVKILDGGMHIHHVLFDNCTIKYQPRMGIEVLGRESPDEQGTGNKGYEHIDITNSYFEASAGEAISYDDDFSENANRAGSLTEEGNLLVKGNHVEGAGVGTLYAYGQVIENNGVRGVKWENNYFGAGRDGIVNIQGRDQVTPMNMKAIGNTYDSTHLPAGVIVTGDHQVFGAHDIAGGVTFSDTIINDSDLYSSVWAYFFNVHGMDFSGSRVTGITGAASAYYTSPGNNSSGFIWPTKY